MKWSHSQSRRVNHKVVINVPPCPQEEMLMGEKKSFKPKPFMISAGITDTTCKIVYDHDTILSSSENSFPKKVSFVLWQEDPWCASSQELDKLNLRRPLRLWSSLAAVRACAWLPDTVSGKATVQSFAVVAGSSEVATFCPSSHQLEVESMTHRGCFPWAAHITASLKL